MASQYIIPDWMIDWLIVGELKSEWQVVCQWLSKYPWIQVIVGVPINGGLIQYREIKIQSHDFLFQQRWHRSRKRK